MHMWFWPTLTVIGEYRSFPPPPERSDAASSAQLSLTQLDSAIQLDSSTIPTQSLCNPIHSEVHRTARLSTTR